jgi:hypothetical protein|tara:strand:- start:218 stop:556 length:339 start_codon:yes stop_codon:yes gene_type:complete
MSIKLEPSSFNIQLKPEVDEDFCWTGGLEVSISYDKYSPLDKQSFLHLQHLAEIVACSVAFMEENPEVIKQIEDFIVETHDLEDEDAEDHTVETIGDNVVKLSFNSRTKGKA